MEKICIIASTFRTGSTYLTKYIAKYNDYYYLAEFFNILSLYKPFKLNKNNYPELVFNIDKNYRDNELLRLLNNNKNDFIKYNNIVKKNWKEGWFFLNYYLNDNNIIDYKKTKTNNNPYKINEFLDSQKDIILKCNQSIVFKVFPNFFLNDKKININFLKKLEPDLKIIFLERQNILDICISALLADYFKVWNIYDKTKQQTINEKFYFNHGVIDIIFNNLKTYYSLVKKLKNFNCFTIQYDELFKGNKILKLVNKNNTPSKDFLLTKKLYKKYNTKKRLNFLLDKDAFLEFYNKKMIELETEGYK